MNIKVIKTKEEYQDILKEVERLVTLDPVIGSEDANRLELLVLLVKKYEAERYIFEMPSPIEAIKFRMEEQGLRQRDLIPFIGSKSKVSEILSGKRPLTLEMIKALNIGLGISHKVLMQSVKKVEKNDEIDWMKFPIKEMVRRKWIKESYEEIKENASVLMQKYFTSEVGNEMVSALYRRTIHERVGKELNQYSLRAWIARVLLVAKKNEPKKQYNKDIISEDWLKDLVKLSRNEDGILRVQKLLFDSGISLVVEPHLPKTMLDGMAVMTKTNWPVIGLTLRYDRIDYFWFTLIHELVHIWKHLENPDEIYVDNLDVEDKNSKEEQEADRKTRELLVTRRGWRGSDAQLDKTPIAVIKHAKELGIHPAIVAGKVRYESKNYSILNNLVGHGGVRKLFKHINWETGVRENV